jgi:hypothetical protein
VTSPAAANSLQPHYHSPLAYGPISSKVHRTPHSATQAYQILNLFSCPRVTVWDSSRTATCCNRRRQWPLTTAAIIVSGGRGEGGAKTMIGRGGRENWRKNGATMATTTNMTLTMWAGPSGPMPALLPGGSSTSGGCRGITPCTPTPFPIHRMLILYLKVV